jgi:hypothetical protein
MLARSFFQREMELSGWTEKVIFGGSDASSGSGE